MNQISYEVNNNITDFDLKQKSIENRTKRQRYNTVCLTPFNKGKNICIANE